jgi:hypothetical protein
MSSAELLDILARVEAHEGGRCVVLNMQDIEEISTDRLGANGLVEILPCGRLALTELGRSRLA